MHYLIRTAPLKLSARNLKLKASRVGKILMLGLAGFIANITNSIVQVVCNTTLLRWGGDLYVGVMTIINSVRELSFLVVQGVSNGATPVMGFNYGAERYDRVKKAIRILAAITIGYTVLFEVFIMAVPSALVRLFTSDVEMIRAGEHACRLFFSMSIFMSLQTSSQQVFSSLGKSKRAVFFSMLRKVVIAAPLTLILPAWFGLGTDGVFLADAVSQLVGGLACGCTMYFTLYRRMGKGE
jgi:Na+-driven multidrug efflux pump